MYIEYMYIIQYLYLYVFTFYILIIILTFVRNGKPADMYYSVQNSISILQRKKIQKFRLLTDCQN